jgi:hypothetical protein
LSDDAVGLANDLSMIGVGVVEDRIVARSCLPELGELIESGVLVHRHGARAGMLALCDATDDGGVDG